MHYCMPSVSLKMPKINEEDNGLASLATQALCLSIAKPTAKQETLKGSNYLICLEVVRYNQSHLSILLFQLPVPS